MDVVWTFIGDAECQFRVSLIDCMNCRLSHVMSVG